MAREFSGTGQLLSRTTAVVTAVPFTVAGWFWVDDVAANYDLFSLGNSGDDNEACIVRSAGAVASDPLRIVSGGAAGTGTADSSASVTAAAWQHAAGVFAGTTSRTVYLNGGNSGSDSTSSTPAALDRTTLGAFVGASSLNLLYGRLAEWAVWSVALDAADVAALAKGFSPLLIRPTSLVAYWDLLRQTSPEQDRWKSKLDLTLTGAPTKVDHPRILVPVGAQ